MMKNMLQQLSSMPTFGDEDADLLEPEKAKQRKKVFEKVVTVQRKSLSKKQSPAKQPKGKPKGNQKAVTSANSPAKRVGKRGAAAESPPSTMLTRSANNSPAKKGKAAAVVPQKKKAAVPQKKKPPAAKKKPSAKQTARRSTGGTAPRSHSSSSSSTGTVAKKNTTSAASAPAATSPTTSKLTLGADQVWSLLTVDATKDRERVLCDGCGSEGTILDCTLCGHAFSLTECECGLAPGDKAEPYAEDWQAGKHPGCFRCTSTGRTAPVAVMPPCYYAMEGEVSLVVFTIQPRQRHGDWTFRAGQHLTRMLEDCLPAGSFAHFGYQFETEVELAQVLAHAQQVMVNPNSYLPLGTSVSAQCRAVIYFFVHGRASTAQKSAVDEWDAKCLFPVVQVDYTERNAHCEDLPRFLDLVQQQLFTNQESFQVPLQLMSLGTCNMIRRPASDPSGKKSMSSKQNNMAENLLGTMASQFKIDVAVSVGSPDILDLTVDCVSILRCLGHDSRIDVPLAFSRGARGTPYYLFTPSKRIFVVQSSNQVQQINGVQEVGKARALKHSLDEGEDAGDKASVKKQKKLDPIELQGSFFKLINEIELNPPFGKKLSEQSVNGTVVKRGWAFPTKLLREWLEVELGVGVSGHQLNKYLDERKSWIAGQIRYDSNEKYRCWVHVRA